MWFTKVGLRLTTSCCRENLVAESAALTQHLADVGLNVDVLKVLEGVSVEKPEGGVQSDGHPDAVPVPGQLTDLAFLTGVCVKGLLQRGDKASPSCGDQRTPVVCRRFSGKTVLPPSSWLWAAPRRSCSCSHTTLCRALQSCSGWRGAAGPSLTDGSWSDPTVRLPHTKEEEIHGYGCRQFRSTLYFFLLETLLPAPLWKMAKVPSARPTSTRPFTCLGEDKIKAFKSNKKKSLAALEGSGALTLSRARSPSALSSGDTSSTGPRRSGRTHCNHKTSHSISGSSSIGVQCVTPPGA